MEEEYRSPLPNGDFTGVPVGLYLPDEIYKAVTALQEHVDTRQLLGSVSGGRDLSGNRFVLAEAHVKGMALS